MSRSVFLQSTFFLFYKIDFPFICFPFQVFYLITTYVLLFLALFSSYKLCAGCNVFLLSTFFLSCKIPFPFICFPFQISFLRKLCAGFLVTGSWLSFSRFSNQTPNFSSLIYILLSCSFPTVLSLKVCAGFLLISSCFNF